MDGWITVIDGLFTQSRRVCVPTFPLRLERSAAILLCCFSGLADFVRPPRSAECGLTERTDAASPTPSGGRVVPKSRHKFRSSGPVSTLVRPKTFLRSGSESTPS